MKKNLNIAAIAVAALFLCGGTAFAQSGQQGSASQNQQQEYNNNNNNKWNNMSDSTFAKKADRSDLAEVKLGKLAEQKGATDTVRDFGQRMVKDHSNANEQLKDAAQQDNINLPNQPNNMQEQEYNRLSNLSGKEFDRAYARLMVKEHQKDVQALQHEANYGKNAQIKNWASTTLPTIQEHLRLARQMQQDVQNNNSNSGGTGQSLR